jgi:FixJ family two-component response regulator
MSDSTKIFRRTAFTPPSIESAPHPSDFSGATGPARAMESVEALHPSSWTGALQAGPAVYVVDDDADECASICSVLSAAGIVNEAFASPDSFLHRFNRDREACVVLSLTAPAPDGLDVQQQLLEEGANTSLIVVTAQMNVSLVVRAMKAGAHQVFGRPFDQHDFIEAVQEGIDKARERREAYEELRSLRQRWLTLTRRERQVMGLVVAGYPNKRVAAELGTSEKTVKTHRGRVMRKMFATSLPGLVRMADKLDAHEHRAPAPESPGISQKSNRFKPFVQ